MDLVEDMRQNSRILLSEGAEVFSKGGTCYVPGAPQHGGTLVKPSNQAFDSRILLSEGAEVFSK